MRFHSIALGILLAATLTGQTLIPAGAVWRYLDNGSNQGTAWRDPGFNDAGWANGPAQLGYGDGDEATIVSYGPSTSAKYITTYFRHNFSVANPASFLSLTLRVKRDDGVVVYVNGVEAWRSNMPTGAVAYTTLASTAVADDGATFQQTTLSPSLLVAGTNTIAAEIHQSGGTSSDISFDLELTASTTNTITRGPYLQTGTSTGVTVRWRSSVATDSRVQFGPAPASLTSSASDAASTTEHIVTLNGLTAGTRYYYSVGSSTAVLAGADANHTFVTAPLPGAARPTRVWVLGDSGTADNNARAVRDAYYAFNGTRYTDLWLMLGDNAYENGTDSEFQAAVFDLYPSTLRQSVLWPTLGNHDTAQSSNPPGTLPYFQMFTLPTAAQAGGIASGTQRYYSFDFGNIHFVCLDSMTSSRAAGSPMLTWLQNDLAANTKQWLIAFWHHPPYSKGSHNSDTDPILTEMRQNVLPLLESHGVDLVLAGHSHSYERSFLLDGHYGISTTLTSAMILNGGSGRVSGTGAYTKPVLGPSSHAGAVYAVAGSSGKIGGGTLNHPAMFISLNNLGSLVLDVDGARLDASFIRENGVIADTFTMIKGSSGGNLAPLVSITSPSSNASFAAPSSITINANASDSDGTIQQVEFYQGTTLLGIDTIAPYSYTWTGVGAGSYSLTAKAIDNLNASTTSAAVPITVTQPAATLIPTTAIWKYLDNGTNQGTAWRATTFSDAAWKSGPAQLGYGDGDESTVVSFGPNAKKRYVTTYFRHSFQVPNAASITGLQLRLLRDDGAVVYLNGVEVLRSNMPAGAISYTSLASSNVDGASENTFYTSSVSPSLLITGTNVIAVEIHQVNRTSSDLSFNLELKTTP